MSQQESDQESDQESTDSKPYSKAWHCAKCGKEMQFFDGLCWECFGGDPGR